MVDLEVYMEGEVVDKEENEHVPLLLKEFVMVVLVLIMVSVMLMVADTRTDTCTDTCTDINMEDHLVSLLSQHLIAEMSRQKSALEEDQVVVVDLEGGVLLE